MSFLFRSSSVSAAGTVDKMESTHQVRTPEEAVARIAYLSSDVIVSVQPSLATDSPFSSHLRRYASRKDRGLVAQGGDAVPEVRSWLSNALVGECLTDHAAAA
jgi:sulfite reductase (NADPH) hemoprotein beta-component